MNLFRTLMSMKLRVKYHFSINLFTVDPGHNIDILSLEVMAMVCARDQAIQQGIRRWDRVLSARVQCIIDGQSDDGSFGNAITTSLAVQVRICLARKQPATDSDRH